MKYISIVTILFVFNVKAQRYFPNKEYRTNCVDRGYKGKIKAISSKCYCKIYSDSTLNIWRQFTTDSLAKAFFLTSIEEQTFNTNGLLQTITHHNYYFDNKEIGLETDDMQEENESSSIPRLSFKINESTNKNYQFLGNTQQYIYDSLSRLIQVKQLTKNTKHGQGADFIYDAKGNLASSKFWGNNNSLLDAFDNKYDKKDSLIEVEHYNYWANEFDTQKFKYHSKNKYEVLHYLNDGNLYRKEFFNFNDDGSRDYECTWTHRSSFRKRHIISKHINIWQFLSYQFFNDDGKLTVSSKAFKLELNKNGHLTYMEIKDELTNKISKQSYEYTYDDKGNIIKQIGYDSDGKVTSECITSYEYY